MSSGRDVLIVDDEMAIAAALAAALEARGHRVTVAASAEEALELPDPDVLVADLLLGGMDGLELFGELRARGGSPRGVIMPGLPTIDDCRRALRLGAAEFLTKPFAIEELVRVVEAEGDEAAPGGIAPESFSRTYEASSGAVDQAARDMAAWCLRSEVSPATRTRIASSIAELVDNAERHAYGWPRESSAERPIEVNARMDARQLVVEVTDQGEGFDPTRIEFAGATPANSGLARVAVLSEELKFRSEIGVGTQVRVRFTVSTADFDCEERIDLTELDHLTPDTCRELLRTLDEDPHAPLALSPALAVSVGRLLAGPDPKRVLQQALWS